MKTQPPEASDPQVALRETRLLVTLVAWQLVLHLWSCLSTRDPRLVPPHALAYLGDLFLLGVAVAGARGLRVMLPGRLRGLGLHLPVASSLVVAPLLAVYPQLLREYLAFPVNVFASDDGSARVLLTEYLGLSRLWPAAAAVMVATAALVVPFRLPDLGRGRLVLWTVIVLAGVATAPHSPHPFLFSLTQEAMGVLQPSVRVVPSLRRPPPRSDAAAAQPAVTWGEDELLADRVFLIVLEGVTSTDFEADFLGTNGAFFSRVKDRATYHRAYHATNLDSYTSLIAMLTSIQVPYRAYADESLYGAVNRAGNLARALHERGYYTAFVSTYEHQPFVPTRSDWDAVLDRGDLPSLEGWVSLGSSRMEAATEDRAALATIVESAVVHPKAFVLHELVYGHSPEWRARTGRTQLAYYDAYLCELLDRLESSGLDARSLLVVVSDHGDRSRASVAENYRVPLLVVGAHVPPGDDTGFRSHLDLQRIVASSMKGVPLPPARSRVDVVGSTERWVYGAIHADGSSLLVDDATGAVLSSQGRLDASKVHVAFQSLVDEFGVRFGQ